MLGGDQQLQQQHGAAAEERDGQRRSVEEVAQGGGGAAAAAAGDECRCAGVGGAGVGAAGAMGEQLLQAKAEHAELRADIRIIDAALEAKENVFKAGVALLETKQA